MFRLPIIVGICVAAACASARAQLLEAVDLSAQHIVSAAAFRDLQTPGKYYIAPLRLGIAQPAGMAALGIQYFKDNEDAQKRTKAIFTMSVALDAPAAEFEQIKAALAEPGGQVSVAMLPMQYKLSYFVRATGDKPLQKVQVAEGNLAAGATLAVTFDVAAKKQEIQALLSGQNRGFGLVIEIIPTLAFGASRSISFAGDDFLTLLQTVRYLPATAQTDGSNALVDWLRVRIDTWGTGEETAARNWLAALLGPPELTLDENNAPRFGWDLTRASLKGSLQGKRPTLRSITARSGKPSFGPILSLGNICANYPGLIVNLDTGLTGCNGLN